MFEDTMMAFEPVRVPYRKGALTFEALTVFEPTIDPYTFVADTLTALMVFDPYTFPYRFDAETYPLVLIPKSETYVFVPTDRRFKGFEFTIPMLPKVMREVPGFVN